MNNKLKFYKYTVMSKMTGCIAGIRVLAFNRREATLQIRSGLVRIWGPKILDELVLRPTDDLTGLPVMTHRREKHGKKA